MIHVTKKIEINTFKPKFVQWQYPINRKCILFITTGADFSLESNSVILDPTLLIIVLIIKMIIIIMIIIKMNQLIKGTV